MNVGEWVRKWGLLAPKKTAIIDDGREFSYEELNRRCNRLANFLLEKGVKKRDRIGVLIHNGHEILEVYLASAKLGAIFIPLNWLMAPPQIEYILLVHCPLFHSGGLLVNTTPAFYKGAANIYK